MLGLTMCLLRHIRLRGTALYPWRHQDILLSLLRQSASGTGAACRGEAFPLGTSMPRLKRDVVFLAWHRLGCRQRSRRAIDQDSSHVKSSHGSAFYQPGQAPRPGVAPSTQSHDPR